MAILLMPLGQGLALLNNMDSVGMLLMPVITDFMEAIPEVQPDLAFQVSHGGHPTSATRIDVPVSCRAGMSPCPATLPP